jgi:Cd2+/Zn2+-exporting ATPase/Cu+-exporting ATPase
MLELLPREVTVRRNGEIVEISSSQLRLGDAVLVSPGGRVPVDGPVVSGHSFVDEAQITGESLPVEKTIGARAYAGTVNQSGVLEITAERLGRDTSYGQIIEVVERAERSRAPVQRLADHVAGYIVYFAIAWAGFNWFLFQGTIEEVISMIVVAGACGVAAGTPLAILGGIGRSARHGAIVKGGIHLETLGKVDTVVLDKTGTLTLGRPEVTALMPAAGISETELLSAAATAELRSEHPLGKAVVERAPPSSSATGHGWLRTASPCPLRRTRKPAARSRSPGPANSSAPSWWPMW